MNAHPRHALARPVSRTRFRVLALTVATLLSVAGFAAPAQAASLGPSTINYSRTVDLSGKSGQVRGSGGLTYAETLQKKVTANNLARATTTCNGCKATAIAFEVVVASGAPTDLTANNTALALNTKCSRCSSTALAYQFVVSNDRWTFMTVSGRIKLSLINVKLAALAKSGASPETMQAKADDYAAQVRSILAQDLRTFPTFRRAFKHVDLG